VLQATQFFLKCSSLLLMFNTYYFIIYSVFTIFFTCNGMIPSIHTKNGDMSSLQIIKFTLLKNLIIY